MSGFNPGPRVRRIEFDDTTPFPGLWMRVGGMTLNEWMTLKLNEAVELFADRLLEWNWEDDAGPVPCDLEGLARLDIGDIRTLVGLWSDKVAAVRARPLGPTGNGQTPPDPELEASIPMGPAPPDSGN